MTAPSGPPLHELLSGGSTRLWQSKWLDCSGVRIGCGAWADLATGSVDIGRQGERLPEVLQLLSKVYTAVQEVSGAAVIVDSSKSPSYAHLLSRTPGVQVHLVHLVRDCRGVAYSRLRRNARGELHWRSENLLVARTALEWGAVNVLSHLLKSRLPYTLVRYEDFVNDPEHTLRRIVSDAGQPTPNLSFVNMSSVLVGADHIVSGNQMRFESGWISVKADEEWRHKLARRHLWILNAIAWPWLARYGYV